MSDQERTARTHRSSTSTSRSTTSCRWSRRCSTWPTRPATWPAPPTSTTACSATNDCGVILCLAGSLISAGLKKVFVDMIRNHMVDCHRQHRRQHRRPGLLRGPRLPPLHRRRAAQGRPGRRRAARAAHRPHLRHADRRGRAARSATTRRRQIADELPPRPYSSREFIREMGAYLAEHGKTQRLDRARRLRSTTCRSSARRFPTARPASAWWPTSTPAAISPRCRIDSGKDFYELTQLKIKNPTTGIFMIGGGVPKNFTQDIVVAAEILGHDAADAQVRRAGHRGRRPRRRPVQLARSRKPRAGARSTPSTSRWSSAKPRWPCR